VTSAELDALRLLNLGARALRQPVTAEGVLREVRRYDAGDAAAVSRRVREHVDRAGVEEGVVAPAAGPATTPPRPRGLFCPP